MKEKKLATGSILFKRSIASGRGNSCLTLPICLVVAVWAMLPEAAAVPIAIVVSLLILLWGCPFCWMAWRAFQASRILRSNFA
jgi:hypothetical protein